ncbi:MAG: hypothetical protein ACJ75M_03675 [Actinomycetes bacterium]
MQAATAASGTHHAAGRRVDLLVVGLWLATRAVLLVVSLNPRLYSAALFGDVRFYGAKVERMLQGELPYRDVATEYPPGSVPFTILPALVVGTGAGYRLAFACEMLAVDAVGLWAATRLSRVVDPGRPRRIPLAYVLAMVAVGPLLVLRFDLVPAVCVLAAAAMAAEGRFGWAAAALGYGTAAKIFPGVLAPLLVLGLVPALGWWRSLLRTVPPFLAGFGLTVVPALALSVRGTADSVLYHVQRGVQVESLWANLIGVAHVFGLPAHTVYGFGAYDLASEVSGVAKALSGVLTLAALAGAAWLIWRRARARDGLGPADWAGAFTLGTFAFVLPSRVLSPQYLVWLCAPMVGLAMVLAGRRALWTLVAAALVSQVIFPFRYTQLRRLYPFDIGLMTLRNLLLVVACALVVRAFNRPPPEPEGAVGTAG